MHLVDDKPDAIMLPENLELVTAPGKAVALTFSHRDPYALDQIACILVDANRQMVWEDLQGNRHPIDFKHPLPLEQIQGKMDIFLCALNHQGVQAYRTVPLHHETPTAIPPLRRKTL